MLRAAVTAVRGVSFKPIPRLSGVYASMPVDLSFLAQSFLPPRRAWRFLTWTLADICVEIIRVQHGCRNKDFQSNFKTSTCSGNAENTACKQRVLAGSSPMTINVPTSNNNTYAKVGTWTLVDGQNCKWVGWGGVGPTSTP